MRSNARIIRPPDVDGLSVVCLGVRSDQTYYVVTATKTDDGRAFTMVRLGARLPYHVQIGLETSCDCTGFLAHAHCKHVDGVRELLARDPLAL